VLYCDAFNGLMTNLFFLYLYNLKSCIASIKAFIVLLYIYCKLFEFDLVLELLDYIYTSYKYKTYCLWVTERYYMILNNILSLLVFYFKLKIWLFVQIILTSSYTHACMDTYHKGRKTMMMMISFILMLGKEYIMKILMYSPNHISNYCF